MNAAEMEEAREMLVLQEIQQAQDIAMREAVAAVIAHGYVDLHYISVYICLLYTSPSPRD